MNHQLTDNMLAISEMQWTMLREAMWIRLKDDLVRLIKRDFPDKARGRDDALLERYAQTMIDIGVAYRLERVPSFHRLVSLQMRNPFGPQLTAAQRLPMEEYALDESVRLDLLEATLQGRGTVRVIDLDTPLSLAEGLDV